MSTKPTELPRWATDPLPDTVISPPSDKRDIGWLPGERPPAEYVNWLLQKLYYWVEWLDDGDCAFDALSAVTLAVSGTSTLQTLSVPGTATIATLAATSANVTALTATSANVTTLTAGGTTITGPLSVAGLISNGTKPLVIPTSSSVGTNATRSSSAESWDLELGSVLYYPVHVEAGRRIASAAVVCDIASGSQQLDISLNRKNLLTGVSTTVAAVTVNTSGRASFSIPAINHTVVATDQYNIRVARADIIVGTCIVYGATVNVDYL